MLTKMFLEKKESYMFLAIFSTALDVVLYVNFTVRRLNKLSKSISSVVVGMRHFLFGKYLLNILRKKCFCFKWQLLHSKYVAAVDCSSFLLHLKKEKCEFMVVIPNIYPSMVVGTNCVVS